MLVGTMRHSDVGVLGENKCLIVPAGPGGAPGRRFPATVLRGGTPPVLFLAVGFLGLLGL